MKDFIIIGFGLAGLHTAYELQKRNQSFLVIDNHQNNASDVAGGIINPLILKRFTKAWMAEKFVPEAKNKYRSLEKYLSKTYFHPTPIYRKINSIKEQNDWLAASGNLALSEFMGGKLNTLKELPNPHHYGKVLKSSFIDIKNLIQDYRYTLINNESFLEEKFDYQKLQISPDEIIYKNTKARNIIFCEGIGMLNNPFFNKLPLIGNKGEYLILRIPNLEIKPIIKTSMALIPLGNNLYKFGATYSRDYTNTLPEKESKKKLIKKLEEIISVPYKIIKTEVGIRPTVRDRKPLIGKHPKNHNFYLFNGLGTHGIMTAPTLANWLCDYILEDQPLLESIDINRYYTRKKDHLKE